MSCVKGHWDLFEEIDQPPADPSRPEVVLIAGFLGLHLATHGGQRVWLTPPAFALRDVATELGIGPGGLSLVPDGLNEIVYSEMVRGLRGAGLTTHAFAFDFRRSVAEVARDLAEALLALGPNRRFALVTHSLGALVASVYPLIDLDWMSRIDRVIHLGGTLPGTFEVVDAALGAHPIISRLSDLSLRNGPEDYAACMRSWPSLYEMLPDPALFEGGARAFEADAWAPELRPDPELLATALQTRDLVQKSPLAAVPTHHLLSVRFSTADGYAEGAIAPRRPRTAAGDGTVSARAALSLGAPVHRVDLPHTLIPLDPKAIRGVIELVTTGETTLPRVTSEDAGAPIEGTEPTIDDIVREYVGTTLLHPERIPHLLQLCLLLGPPGI